ncbi:sugar porter family MFS transporter [Paraburkholderia sp.]|uniref:sugar porter family MFS transporter n=1 Tax=Paraburkholderia sp. TaxID=1926495 RepID=UPI0023A44763|nr:sugar porter family MFS transporter [Paraburkholderia sp.]MDE1180794.1 sugar porter family MFS transporter [Paraburkholderia sp.]
MSTTHHPIAHGGAPAHRPFHIVLTSAIAALAGLLFGLDIGVISGALPFIARHFQVGDQMQEWIVSSMMVGAAIGALGSGWMARAIGRKLSLMIGAALFACASAVCAFAIDPAMLIGGRVLLGLAVGIASFTAPLYLSEIAPRKMRGALISLHQLMVTVGILAAFLSNTAFSGKGDWRWMLGVIAFPAIAMLIGLVFLPRSPRWLMSVGRRDEAQAVLNRLRGDEKAIQTEMREIDDQLKVEFEGWGLFRSNRNFRRSVLLGVLLQIAQQLTGINVVMYYAPRIFGLAGYGSAHDQLWGTVIVGIVNVAATFIAIGLVDRWGRKPILYTGFTVMAAALASLGMLMHIGITTPAHQYAAVAALMIFIAGFAMSAGPMIWILCAEIQPIKGRDFGIAVSTFVNWVANTIAGATFLTLLNTLGHAQTFWLYAVLNAAFLLMTFWIVPETKDVSLEQIERNLMAGKPLRQLGQ